MKVIFVVKRIFLLFSLDIYYFSNVPIKMGKINKLPSSVLIRNAFLLWSWDWNHSQHHLSFLLCPHLPSWAQAQAYWSDHWSLGPKPHGHAADPGIHGYQVWLGLRKFGMISNVNQLSDWSTGWWEASPFVPPACRVSSRPSPWAVESLVWLNSNTNHQITTCIAFSSSGSLMYPLVFPT